VGFGTCCGETSRTAFAVRSGKPVMTVSRRVRTPDRSGLAAGGCGGVGAGAGGVGTGVGGCGSPGGCEGGTGFVSDMFSNLSIARLGGNSGIAVGTIPEFPPGGESQVTLLVNNNIKRPFECRHFDKSPKR
jgi:hypothetical protein